MCYVKVFNLIGFSACVLRESQLLIGLGLLAKIWECQLFIGLGLLPVCYGEVDCVFDWIVCLCDMGKLFTNLIRFTICVLWGSRLLI